MKKTCNFVPSKYFIQIRSYRITFDLILDSLHFLCGIEVANSHNQFWHKIKAHFHLIDNAFDKTDNSNSQKKRTNIPIHKDIAM